MRTAPIRQSPQRRCCGSRNQISDGVVVKLSSLRRHEACAENAGRLGFSLDKSAVASAVRSASYGCFYCMYTEAMNMNIVRENNTDRL